MAPAVAMKVGACRKSSTPLTLQRAGNLLEGAKRGIGNLVFVTLPPDLLRVLRAGVPGESYVKGCLLLPWHAPGPPAVLPLGPTALTLTPSLRSLPPSCSLASLPHRLRPQRVPLCLRKIIPTLLLKGLLLSNASPFPKIHSLQKIYFTLSSTSLRRHSLF